MQASLQTLQALLKSYGRVAVAYSGGVDSALLLKVAHDALGADVLALTAVSPSMPARERQAAIDLAAQIGARHMLVETPELNNPEYLANSPQRCYFCKLDVFGALFDYAQSAGFSTLVDGTNLDDSGDYRPGYQAAVQRGARSPLKEVGFTKDEIRTLARELGLPNWSKPSAACLSSRIPYGTAISLPVLNQIEQAERFLLDLGLRQVRVRHHQQIARIEVEAGDLPVVLERRAAITKALKELGYTYITLDLAGFRSGSLNEVLAQPASAA
jgi:uncharacterized protein